MKIKNSNKIEIWQKHILAAPLYPAGITAYLKDNGINPSTFYNWQSHLKSKSDKGLTKPSEKAKKRAPSFLPLVIAEHPVTAVEMKASHRLPEARWVAEVLLHIARGLS